MDKMFVGIIGAGSISKVHIRAFQKLDDVVVQAVCDLNKERAESVAEEFNIPSVYSDVDGLLGDEKVDSVTICVLNSLHSELSIKALNAGKNVLCEKPMARNSFEAASMVEAEKESGKTLMIGLVRRFDEKTNAALSLVREGVLGKIYYIKAGYLRRNGQPGGWFTHKKKSGGGSLLDIGIHSLDLAMYLAGLGKVSSVSGFIQKLPQLMTDVKGSVKYESSDSGSISDVDDMAVADLRFENGTLLHLECSWAQHIPEDKQFLEIYGDKGGLIVDPQLQLISNHNNYLSSESIHISSEEDYLDNLFSGEMAHFRDVVLKGESCRSPSDDGVALMEIIDAIYESAEKGIPVKL